MVESQIRTWIVRTNYLMKVDAKAVGISINPGKLCSLAVLWTSESDACPSGIDVHPYGRIASLDYSECQSHANSVGG